MTMTQNDLFCQDNCQNATQSLGQIRSWSFRSNSFSDGKKVLKIVYINNILFIYTIFRTFFPSENEFDRNDHDRI